MKAELKPRIDLDNRTKLETVIPLSTPYLVFLDPSDICNAKCSFCPTGTGEAKKYKKAQLMEWELYKKIIGDLVAMPEVIKTLRLYMMGEPLLNPRFPDMVRYAKDTKRFGQIDTTTNGLLLDTKLIQWLSVSELDKIFISVPQGYTQEYVSNVIYLRLNSSMQIYVKIIGDGMLEVDKQRFLDDFEQFCDRIFIEYLSPCWPDSELKIEGEVGIYGQPLTPAPKICPYPFYSLSINSDGTVSLCFLDWQRKLFLGDLKQQSFSEIWNGDLLRDYRRMMLRGDRCRHPICGECGQLSYGAPDNIDKFAAEIFGRL